MAGWLAESSERSAAVLVSGCWAFTSVMLKGINRQAVNAQSPNVFDESFDLRRIELITFFGMKFKCNRSSGIGFASRCRGLLPQQLKLLVCLLGEWRLWKVT